MSTVQYLAPNNLWKDYYGRKAMTNLHSILKGRDITLPTKVHLVKARDLPVSCPDVRVGQHHSSK